MVGRLNFNEIFNDDALNHSESDLVKASIFNLFVDLLNSLPESSQNHDVEVKEIVNDILNCNEDE